MSNIVYKIAATEEKFYVRRQQNITWPNPDNPADENALRKEIADYKGSEDITYAAVDEQGRVVAGMSVLQYMMYFDGHRVLMPGIAGVVSLPEYRRQGNIRKLFEKVFEDSMEKGAVFSHLYPFSHNYYRKFGYEQCGFANKYTLPVAPARALKSDGTAHEYIKGGSERSGIINVYEKYASRHNMMISRSDENWDDVLDISLLGKNRLYYRKDSKGEINAWVKYQINNKTIDIIDFAWNDYEGLSGILQYMGMFDGAADEMSLLPGPEFIPELYWDNAFSIKIEAVHLGMNRVMDASRALELMKKPAGSGSFTIKVTDGFAKWNNNTYKVEYGEGESKVSELGASAASDIEVNERALMLLVLGCYSFDKLVQTDAVQVNSNKQTLEKVFIKKPVFITDRF